MKYERRAEEEDQTTQWRYTKFYVIFIYVTSIIIIFCVTMVSLLYYCYDGDCGNDHDFDTMLKER